MADGLFGTGVAAPSIRPVAIAPTGLPGSTYVRPQQKQVGGNLQALADSLGGLNNALQQFGAVSARADKDPDSEANRAFADSIQGKSLDEVIKTMPEARNRIQKDGVLSLVGSKAAYEFRQHITEQYNNGGFDQAHGDFNSWVEGERQKYAKGLQDPAMQAAFFRGTNDWTQQFGEQDLKRKMENTMAERDTAVVDEFRMIADDGIAANKDPNEIADAIIKQSGENRTFRGLDGKSQNDTLFRLAEEYALKGRPELVKALLNNKRGGIGPLMEVSGYTDKALGLIQRAETEQQQAANATSFKTRSQLDEDAMYGRLTEEGIKKAQQTPGNEWLTDPMAAQYLESSKRAKAQLLAGQAREEEKRRTAFQSTGQRTQAVANAYAKLETLGGAQELQDVEYMGPDGNMKTLTAKDQQDEVVKRKLSQFQELEDNLKANNVDPKQAHAEVLKKRIAWFDGNGIVDEELSKKFNSLQVQSSISRTLEKGEVSKFLGGIAEDYRQLEDINPAYADRMVSDSKSAEFLQNYSVARNDLMGPEDALIYAAQQANRTPTQRALGKLSPDDLADDTKKVLNSLDYDAGPSRDNEAWVQDQLNNYTARGLDRDTARKKVMDKLQNHSFELNGKIVIDEDGLPKDAPELFQRALKDAFTVFGKAEGIPDESDLYIDKYASGQWIVMSKTKGGPLNYGSRIGLNDLAKKRSEMQRELTAQHEATRVADVNARKAARDKLWSAMEDRRRTVEAWEKKDARRGNFVSRYVAKRLRQNYEKELSDYNQPFKPLPPKKPIKGPRGIGRSTQD
ncbi:hypothetical protein [Mesorhizobium sp. LNJC405B00]|uniref:hypothetical protein n=1 Tax=Mesorhizobium sp. LNJC405B00 TaxID=1287281 RepID=UPI0003CE51F4|nr:hypothetical protein [Mesorhizobium sp. LNJC405B00]ESX98708.1 hypothetical protein X755_15240 [Mesorhizobium sp. LNJC405B00]